MVNRGLEAFESEASCDDTACEQKPANNLGAPEPDEPVEALARFVTHLSFFAPD
jgi:hypothetical protein